MDLGELEKRVWDAVLRASRHFGIPPPTGVKIGCRGCPFYDPVTDSCKLGYIACYDSITKTITVSKPEYVREEVILHELLHHVAELWKSGAKGVAGYVGISIEDLMPPTFLGSAVSVLATTTVALLLGGVKRFLAPKRPK